MLGKGTEVNIVILADGIIVEGEDTFLRVGLTLAAIFIRLHHNIAVLIIVVELHRVLGLTVELACGREVRQQ